MQDKLGAGNSSDQEFFVKSPFYELGKLLCLAKHCWKIADWSCTSWILRFANFYMACSGCQWRDCHTLVLCMVVFCYLELLMLHALIPDACNKQPERDFRRGIYFFLILKYFFWSGSLSEHVLQSVQRPVTDLDIFGWGGVAQALQSLGFRGEAGPFDWMRTRVEAVTWNNSSGCTEWPTQKSKSKHSV